MRSEEPTLEQIFAATRTLERRTSRERAELRRNVAARLVAAGVSLSAKAVASSGSASAVSSVAAFKIKVLLGCIVMGGAVAGTAALVPRFTAHSVLGSNSSVVRANPWQPIGERADVATTVIARLPTPKLPSATSARTHSAKPSTASDSLAEELELVRGAQSELAQGHAPKALRLLEGYFQRFPAGLLQPEARAARVRALCLAGRKAESAREAERFARAHPDSPLGRQLQSCQTP